MHILNIFTENSFLHDLYSQSEKNHSTDSGFDLYCPEDILVRPGEQVKIDFQIKCAMSQNKEDSTTIGYLLVPRSSIVKTPIRMSNSIGIIDKDYRGTICAFVDNIKSEDMLIFKGQRYFQIISPGLSPIQCHLISDVEQLGVTSRGEGGFGSTGK